MQRRFAHAMGGTISASNRHAIHITNNSLQGASIPFIVSTGPTRESDDVRRQIRSHVMMGRNRGKARRVKMTQQQTHCSDVAVATGADDDIETSRECSPLSSDSNLPILGFTDPLGASVFTDILASESDQAPSQTRGPKHANEDRDSLLENPCEPTAR